MTFSTSSQQKKALLNNLLFLLMPLAGLAISLIIYIFSYSPVLTENVLSEVAYAKFLHNNGLHFLSDQWNSTKTFFPFGLRFFMTLFADNGTWQSTLFSATCICYIFYCFSFLLLSYAISPKKLLHKVILSATGLILSFLVLISTYSCSQLISYLTLSFIAAAFIIYGIKLKKNIIIRSVICACGLIIFIPFIIIEANLAKNMTFRRTTPASIVSSSKFNIAWTAPSDIEKYYAGPEQYLVGNGINTFYTNLKTARNYFYITFPELTPLIYESAENFSLLSMSDSVPYNSDFSSEEHMLLNCETAYVLTDADAVSNIPTDRLKYIEDSLSNGKVTLLKYPSIRFFFDSGITDAISLVDSNDSALILLNMYDVTTSDEISEHLSALSGKSNTDFPFIIKSINEMQFFLKAAMNNNLNLETIVLRIDPLTLFEHCNNDANVFSVALRDKLLPIVNSSPEITYRIEFPTFCVSHYINADEDLFEKMRLSYSSLMTVFAENENVVFHDMNYDWMYLNENLYCDGSDIKFKDEIADYQMIMNYAVLYFGTKDINLVTDLIGLLQENVREYTESGKKKSEKDDSLILVFGDSIFGNYLDASSIQEIMNYYLPSNVISKAIGGTSASATDMQNVIWGGQLDVNELSPIINSYNPNNLTIIVNFGLNDYFAGSPINSDDAFDNETYLGALNSGLSRIKDNWPNARVIILVPGYISIYDNGNIPIDDAVNILPEYRDTAISFATQNGLEYIELTNCGMSQDSFTNYSADGIYFNPFDNCSDDGVHYNYKGRFIIANYLIDYLSR